MVRALVTLSFVLATLLAAAQVVNGSFEDNGQPSLTGWEWTCGTPVVMPGGAPAAGSFAVTKEPGQTQGCFPSYLFQRLTNVANGDLLTMHAWVRCDASPVCTGAYFGLGRINAGAITAEELTGTMDTSWTYVTFTDTVELGPGDTAVFLLSAGLIGGPIQPTSGWFDGIDLSLPQAIGERADARVQHYPDPAQDRMHVSAGASIILRVDILDMQGRLVLSIPASGAGQRVIDVSSLVPGPHLALVTTLQGRTAFRFIKE